LGTGVAVKKNTTSWQCDLGSVVTAHTVNSQRHHENCSFLQVKNMGAIKQKARDRFTVTGPDAEASSGFRLGFQHFSSTVKTGRADVMTQMHFAGGGFNCQTGDVQRIV